MNPQTVRILLFNELRMLIRDRRTVALAIVLPLLFTPLVFYTSQSAARSRETERRETTFRYAVTGTETDAARALIAAGVSAGRDGVNSSDNSSGNFKIREYPTDVPDASLKSREIHFYLKVLSGEEADAFEKQMEPEEKPAAAAAAKRGEKTQALPVATRHSGVPAIQIIFDGSNTASQSGATGMRDLLRRAIREKRAALLLERGFPLNPAMTVSFHSVAAAGQAAGSRLGSVLTLLMTLLILTGGDMDAADFAGGPALFPKRVIRWYALMGVVIFLAVLNVPRLSAFQPQVIFIQLVIF